MIEDVENLKAARHRAEVAEAAAAAMAEQRDKAREEANRRTREVELTHGVQKRLRAEIEALRAALEPFAEAACHLHPAHADDGVTLDGIEVRHWRAAATAWARTQAH